MVRSGKAPRNLARAKGVGTAASTSRLSVPRPVSPPPSATPQNVLCLLPLLRGLLIGAAHWCCSGSRGSSSTITSRLLGKSRRPQLTHLTQSLATM